MAVSGCVPASPAQQSALPSQQHWLADVHRAMSGSETVLSQRVERAAGGRLAINLDIDNTALATRYDKGAAVADVLALARSAHRHGVAVLFNSARADGAGARLEAKRQLTAVGFPVTEVCLRAHGEELVTGKQRCRRHFRDEGYTLIANVGNNATDFAGSGYERAYRLPNYGQLS
jgi:hypothetical protein